MCSTEPRRAEDRFPNDLWFSPAQLHRQLGREGQTNHRHGQQGCFLLCVPLNSPLPCLAARRPLGVYLRAHPAVASHTSYVGQPWDNFSLVTGLPSCCTLQELDNWCYCEGLPTACTQGWAQDLDLSLHSLDTCPFVRGKLKAPRCLCSVGPLPTSRPKGSS